MKITTIRVERLHTFACFDENEKFTAEAVVDEGEDPVVAFNNLRRFVEDQINSADVERKVAEEESLRKWKEEHPVHMHPDYDPFKED